MKKKRILITGAAGFIGFYLSRRLLEEGHEVTGVDNINDYYDPALKEARLNMLHEHIKFNFYKTDIADRKKVERIFRKPSFDIVVNLAAQAGVRYSLTNPEAYVDTNLVGFANILENCRRRPPEHLVFASSSSVYGASDETPFSIKQRTDKPVSLYAATKKANELMAHTYAHLYQLPCTGLRFFTVYGPWGRPDMAYFKFTKAIMDGEPIDVYNNGHMQRDFTYIDDIIEGTVRVMNNPPPKSKIITYEDSKGAPFKLYNIGNNNPVELGDFIKTLENSIGKTAVKNMLPMQPGDVPSTFADISSLEHDVGFKPYTPLEKGLKDFVGWYKSYYRIENKE